MDNKPTLIIMCGVPGAGKDYHIMNHRFFENLRANVVSRDAIRFSMLKDGDDYFKNENKVFNQFVREIVIGLNEGRNVVANATHINRASRDKLIKAIDSRVSVKDYNIMFFVVQASYETILKQNNRRVGLKRVPDDTITNMFSKFSMPGYHEDKRITDVYVLRNGKLMRKEGGNNG